MTCKWYNVCPLRRFEKQGKLDYAWSQNFCRTESNWKNCKRYQLEEIGRYHPDNMSPNGKIDKNLS
ncbi:MAG: hypothetical protein JW715_02135 [Sedimentisphaerales bacterium]|nr:hypothetical protein [Sedimentisphaerales bacterium]